MATRIEAKRLGREVPMEPMVSPGVGFKRVKWAWWSRADATRINVDGDGLACPDP